MGIQFFQRGDGLVPPNEMQTIVYIPLDTVAVGGAVYTVPADKKLYVHAISWVGSTNDDIKIWDTTTVYLFSKNNLASFAFVGGAILNVIPAGTILTMNSTNAGQTVSGFISGWLQ